MRLFQSDVIQGDATRSVTAIMMSFKKPLMTGSTMYRVIDGYLCDNVVYPDILQSRTNYQVMPSAGWTFSLVRLTDPPPHPGVYAK